VRCREIENEFGKGFIVYLSQEEKEDEEIKRRIEALKKRNKNVAVFVSGKKEMGAFFEQILRRGNEA
jgi:hypothetical protein